MKATEKQKMYNDIQRHGENLNAIFNTGIEPVVLCKKLFRLEKKANQLAHDYCNGENGVSTETWESKQAPILAAVRKILFPKGMTNTELDWCIFINGDARGYALKIDSEYMKKHDVNLYKDWGGFGIIAPDFNP